MAVPVRLQITFFWLLLFGSAGLCAQPCPTKPIRLLVGYAVRNSTWSPQTLQRITAISATFVCMTSVASRPRRKHDGQGRSDPAGRAPR